MEDWISWAVSLARAALEAASLWKDEVEAFKVVAVGPGSDGKDEIAGYALWAWSAEAQEKVLGLKKRVVKPAVGRDMGLSGRFAMAMEEIEGRCHPGAPYYELLDLVTHPSHQRRGIGSRLVSIGVEMANKEGVLIYLSVAPMGVPVYRKSGFKEVGRAEVPFEVVGQDGEKRDLVHVHVAMIKEPSSSTVPVPIEKEASSGINHQQ